MGKLVFELDDRLKRIIEHADTHEMGTCYGEQIKIPSLLLVKDRGAYLMSAAAERQPADQGDNAVVLVAYADGHHPDKPGYTWENTQDVCGGDDFAEPIRLSFFRDAVAQGASKVIIGLYPTRMTLETA